MTTDDALRSRDYAGLHLPDLDGFWPQVSRSRIVESAVHARIRRTPTADLPARSLAWAVVRSRYL